MKTLVCDAWGIWPNGKGEMMVLVIRESQKKRDYHLQADHVSYCMGGASFCVGKEDKDGKRKECRLVCRRSRRAHK